MDGLAGALQDKPAVAPNAIIGGRTMQVQSCYRRLCGGPGWIGSLALAALLTLAVPYPAASSGVHTTTAHTPRWSSVLPDTTWSVDTMNTVSTIEPHRRRAGYVVTEEQLELEQEYPLSSVIVAHFPGLRVVRGVEANRVASGIHVNITGEPCYVQMFIDGVMVADGDVDMVNVRDLALLEFHTPGNIPVQFQNRLAGAPCGVLLLWLKV